MIVVCYTFHNMLTGSTEAMNHALQSPSLIRSLICNSANPCNQCVFGASLSEPSFIM